MDINYTPSFIRFFDVLPEALKKEVLEKIEIFKDKSNHKQLKVHKLKGAYKNFHAFSINYSHRIIFEYINKKSVVLHKVGNHDIYKD